jgi:cyclophilin family peptidyl-prolyl cis-trans isomerase
MQFSVQLLRRSTQLMAVALILMSILAISIGLGIQQPIASAQDDAQTPDALCEAALPDVEEPDDRAFSAGPEQVLEAGVDYYAILCTGEGAVYINLFEQYTPQTVNSFVFLAQSGYYNNTNFHRVLANFMVQGGDHTGTGSGGPGYQFADEVLPFLAMSNPGVLAMANSGPGTNGSQFFVTRVPTQWLHGAHTVFGKVIEGQSVVDNMTDRDPATATESGVTLNTVLIITDPSTVDVDYTPPPVPTAQDTIDTINASIDEIFVQGPAVSPTVENVFESVDDAVGQFDGDAQEIAAELYEAHGFNHEVGGFWEVDECPTERDLLGVGFSMIDLDSEENAAAFVDDENLTALQQAQGFVAVEDEGGYLASAGFTTNVIYTKSEESICETLNSYTRYVWNRGRYVMVFDVIITEGVIPTEQLPAVAANLGFVFSGYVGDIILAGGEPTIGFE